MPKFVEEIPLLEGVQGTIDGSPSIKKKPLNIYDLYALLTQGLQKKVTSLGYATKALKKSGKPTFPNQLKSNDYRLKVLAFTAEAVRQFLSSALNEEVLHIPQKGTLRPHGKAKAGAHPAGFKEGSPDKVCDRRNGNLYRPRDHKKRTTRDVRDKEWGQSKKL